MKLTLKTLVKIGEILSSIGSAIRSFAVQKHLKQEIETQLPSWPEHEQYSHQDEPIEIPVQSKKTFKIGKSKGFEDNFSTREGEHDHV
jgi:hypothetical protein